MKKREEEEKEDVCKGANNNKQSTRAASRQMEWRGMTDDVQADADVDHAVTTREKYKDMCMHGGT